MIQKLGISQNQRSRFNPIEAASIQKIGAMQIELKIESRKQRKTNFRIMSGI
ncbi:MAG: hypothetical protein KDK76_03370 [Chlamydiia bacterium]|nr:hypothetical protein [Chlamydiia bacterium]